MPPRIRCASRSSKPLSAASLVLLFGFALRPGGARADTPGGDPRRGERRVVVLDAGPEAVDTELADVLAELLARLHLDLVRRGSPSAAPVVARVGIESSERGAVVTITGRRDSTPVRREIERGDSPAVFRETVAHVILGAVEPLASSDQEPSPPPVSAPVDAPAAPAVTRASEAVERHAVWSLGGRAGPRFLAADRASIGFGGFAGLTLPMSLHPSAGLHAGYVLPARLSRDGVDAVFGLVPLRVQAGIEPLAAKSVALDVALAFGVDIVWLIPEAGPPQSQLGPSTTRLQPMIGAASSARFRLAPKADLVLTLGVDLDAAPRHWVIAAGPAHNPLFEMSRFRPYATVGFDWMLGGSISPGPSESSP